MKSGTFFPISLGALPQGLLAPSQPLPPHLQYIWDKQEHWWRRSKPPICLLFGHSAYDTTV